jgi:hypothetical protein
VQQLQLNKANASASVQQINHMPPMDIFQIETATEMFRNLITSLDTEGRYLLLNAIANQLRYPNSHTHYFSFIILYLFAEATQVLQDVACTITCATLLSWVHVVCGASLCNESLDASSHPRIESNSFFGGR